MGGLFGSKPKVVTPPPPKPPVRQPDPESPVAKEAARRKVSRPRTGRLSTLLSDNLSSGKLGG